jgi:hypothetical protein
MLFASLIFIFTAFGDTSDTLLYPIEGGKIEYNRNELGFHKNLELEIYPTTFFEVKSCSNGKVLDVKKETDRYSIIVSSTNLYYSYIVDSVLVEKGNIITTGFILGRLKKQVDISKKSRPLILTIMKGDKFIDPTKYMIFKRKA